MEIISKSVKRALLTLLHAYQQIVKPWLVPCCRYQPTCSSYAELCLKRLPLGRATYLIIKRILSCSPLAKGGVDMDGLDNQTGNHA